MSEITGKLTVKNETKEYGSNGFKKREFVIKTEDSQYPQEILIELIQDKCSLLDSYNIGDTIKIAYNLNGRSWVNPQGETKYFNSIQGWRIQQTQGQNQQAAQANQAATNLNEGNGDGLPF